MQVFKTFLKISLTNLSSNVIYLVIFLVLALVLTGSNSANLTTGFTAEKINVALIDRDNTALSQKLNSYIAETQIIKEINEDESKWPDELFYHTAEIIIILEKGFEEKIMTGDYEEIITTYANPDSNKAYIVENQLNTYVSYIRYYLTAGYDYETAATKAAEISSENASVSYLNPDTEQSSTSAIGRFYNYYPYIILCIIINSLAPMIQIWNRPGIKARTNVSSLSSTKRTTGIMAATATYSILVFASFILISFICFPDDAGTIKGLLYYMNAFVYLLVSIAIAFLIGQICKNPSVPSMISNVFGLTSSFLCGVFVMRSLLPEKVVMLSKCLPTYWYINIIEELQYSSGNELSSLAIGSIIIQLLFAVAIYAVALVFIKLNRQKNN